MLKETIALSSTNTYMTSPPSCTKNLGIGLCPSHTVSSVSHLTPGLRFYPFDNLCALPSFLQRQASVGRFQSLGAVGVDLSSSRVYVSPPTAVWNAGPRFRRTVSVENASSTCRTPQRTGSPGHIAPVPDCNPFHSLLSKRPRGLLCCKTA